jgi:hypothetical protein
VVAVGVAADDPLEVDAFPLEKTFLLGDQERPSGSGQDDVAVIDRCEFRILLRLSSIGNDQEQKQRNPSTEPKSAMHRRISSRRWTIRVSRSGSYFKARYY